MFNQAITLNTEEVKAIASSAVNFAYSYYFIKAVDSATAIDARESAYSVRFTSDGSHEVLWNKQINDNHTQSGVIFPIPTFTTEQLKVDSAADVDFSSTIEEFKVTIQNWEADTLRVIESGENQETHQQNSYLNAVPSYSDDEPSYLTSSYWDAA